MRVLMALCMLAAIVLPASADPATDAINQLRAQASAAPLIASDALARAAEGHAQDMARHGYFAHQGRNGSSVGDRVRAQGYGFCFVAENIAQGQTSLTEVLQSWANSPGHRRNMLDRRATEAALARGDGNLWVLVLAAPGC